MKRRQFLTQLAVGMVALTAPVSWRGLEAAPAQAASLNASPTSQAILNQVIEGARREGKVVARTVGFPTKLVDRTKREISQTYGVDLSFDVGPTGGQARMVAQLLSEQAAGVPVTINVV